jgi:hypothetical protein
MIGKGFPYLARPGSPGRSTARRPSRAAEEGRPRTKPAVAAGSSGTHAVGPAGGPRPPAAGTRRRRTGARRCRTGAGAAAAAADTAAPRAGTRRRRRRRSGPCRLRQASRRPWRWWRGGFAPVGGSIESSRRGRDGDD